MGGRSYTQRIRSKYFTVLTHRGPRLGDSLCLHVPGSEGGKPHTPQGWNPRSSVRHGQKWDERRTWFDYSCLSMKLHGAIE